MVFIDLNEKAANKNSLYPGMFHAVFQCTKDTNEWFGTHYTGAIE